MSRRDEFMAKLDALLAEYGAEIETENEKADMYGPDDIRIQIVMKKPWEVIDLGSWHSP